ncbi:hypothetical protein OAS39_01255 [Pirellulales bacterium]|nr:hypothetical protein [Pirellulales bacterium]
MKHSSYISAVRSTIGPARVTGFIALVVLAAALNWCTWEPSSFAVRRGFRELGYAALLMLLIAYAYWPRQWFLDRPWFRMEHWLRWHIGASWAALGLTLIHSLGCSGSPLTFWMMVLFWSVIGSGVAGYFGQKACYRILSFIVDKECGPEQLDDERRRLIEEFTKTFSKQPPGIGVSDERYHRAVQEYLASGWKSWSWLFGRAALEPVSANLYERTRELSDGEERARVETLWLHVQQRRELDIERLFHRLSRRWRVVHQVSAGLLFFLVIAHVVSSIRLGGW